MLSLPTVQDDYRASWIPSLQRILPPIWHLHEELSIAAAKANNPSFHKQR